MNLFISVNTVIITNFYYRTPVTHSMPVWLRRFFLFVLPPILWMDAPTLRKNSFVDNQREQSLVIENPVHIDQVTSMPLVSLMIIHSIAGSSFEIS